MRIFHQISHLTHEIGRHVAYYGEQIATNPKVQAVVGGGVTTVSIPLWLQYVQSVGAAIGAVCGAIIGLFGVYRLIRGGINSRKGD